MNLDMMAMDKHWYQRYRSMSISEMILPSKDKEVLLGYVKDKFVPSVLFVGPAGTGKTSAALALMRDIGSECLIINSSMYGDIDTMRTTVASYASSMSLTSDGQKYVIFEEADGITPKAFDAVRNVFEATSTNCSFILTANKIHKIPEPIRQRCIIFNMQIPRNERTKLLKETFLRACYILDTEKVTYDGKAVLEVVKQYFPRHRSMINALQKMAKAGDITMDSLGESSLEAEWAELFKSLQNRDFKTARAWVSSNSDIESDEFYKTLYENLSNIISADSVPSLVVDIAKYQFQETMAVNTDINRAACLAEIMFSVKFR